MYIYKKNVKVDRKMATNLKGCYVAGDIVGTPYQLPSQQEKVILQSYQLFYI